MRDNKYSENRKVLCRSAVRSSKIASFFIVFLIIICHFPIVVYASDSIYMHIESGTGEYTGFDFVSGSRYKQYISNYENPSVYATFVFSDSDYNNAHFVVISDTNYEFQFGGFLRGWANGGTVWTRSMDYDSDTHLYYYVHSTTDKWTNYDNNSHYLINQNVSSLSGLQLFNYVLSVEDPYAGNHPTNWGNPADVNISTIYSGNVQNSPSNIDKFTWNNSVDSNGISYISHFNEHPVIEVQAVPITWKTSTREEMENQSGADATIGTGVPLDSYNARTGHLEVTWQEVINYLQIQYADIYSYFFDGTYWIMKGWFYQIRLVTDNYTGDWITLSNGLNLTPKKSKKLIEDPYDETIYNILKEISETNGQTTTVYEYGDNNYITINNDPTSGWQSQDGGGSFWDFLASVVKAISDGIASIVSSVASLVGDLVNGILGLFTFDTFEINNYNTEVQTLKENSGIFGQSIEFADSIKDSIRGVEQQPAVLHFDGIVIDNVQLIPAVDLDFDQIVVDAGLTDFHNLVYVFTDGTILISLIIMVHRKVMEVLRK